MIKSLFLKISTPVLVLLYGLAISFFYRLFYFSSFHPDTWVAPELALALVHGIRFDLSALFYLNFLFFIAFPFKVARKSTLFILLWSFALTLYLLTLGANYSYFSIYSSNLSLSFLSTLNGISFGLVLPTVAAYWYAPLFLVAFLFAHYRIIKKLLSRPPFRLTSKNYFTYFTLVLVFTFLGIRGGLQKRVLGIPHTWVFAEGSSFFASLTANPLHSIIRGKKNGVNIPQKYYSEAKKLLSFNKNENFALKEPPQNVLFIFVESLSSYPVENGYTPYLKKWLDENQEDAFATTNFYANGIFSKDALVSTLFGLPSYFELHFFESKYASNKIHGLGKWAKENNLDPFFLDAAPYGTQFFDAIVTAAEVDYISIYRDYKNEIDESMHATWGIDDKAFYSYASNYIKNKKVPFLGFLFTASSHFPFKGTPNNRLGSGDLSNDYLKSIQYADTQLVNFLNTASKEKWFSETLIIITGDHPPPIPSKWLKKKSEFSRVPLFLYFKGSKLNSAQINKLGKHADLAPSLFHIFKKTPKSWTPYGQSLFASNCKTQDKCNSSLFFTKDDTAYWVPKPHTIKAYSLYDENLPQKISKELKDYIFRLENNLLKEKLSSKEQSLQ